MSTVVLGEQPEIAEWLERRRALGQDSRDEVWEGVYHVAPLEHTRNVVLAQRILRALEPRATAAGLEGIGPFNLGVPRNYRSPDAGWLAVHAPLELFMPSAVAVLEVLSPDDETYQKFEHYGRHGVQEILVAHPGERWITCYRWTRLDCDQRDSSTLFGVTMAGLCAEVEWP